MKRWVWLVLIFAGGLATGRAAEEKGRYAIVLQAGAETNEGTVRAAHALLYARELAEKGYGVVLIFDGAGTGWANELRKPECPLYPHYMKIKALGLVEEICDYCADSFNVKGDLPVQQQKLLVGEYLGHQGLVKWIEKGYQVIVL